MCRSAALISNCRLVENTAGVSEAVSLILRGSLTLTLMLPRSLGGAMSIGLNGSHVRVQESRFKSNYAKVRNSSLVSIVQQSGA